jgi:hypothetical protein
MVMWVSRRSSAKEIYVVDAFLLKIKKDFSVQELTGAIVARCSIRGAVEVEPLSLCIIHKIERSAHNCISHDREIERSSFSFCDSRDETIIS